MPAPAAWAQPRDAFYICAVDPKPPDRVVDGRYRLIQRIGRGELGVVWTAEDELLGRAVAVKQVTPPAHLGEDERRRVQQRILRGAHTAARLETAFAANVYDVVAEGSTSWIVMERFEAPSLDEVLRESGPLSVAETTAVGMALLEALRVAHAAEVLHRDVKPTNVMLTYRGAVLTDFGIAAPDGDPAPAPSGTASGDAVGAVRRPGVGARTAGRAGGGRLVCRRHAVRQRWRATARSNAAGSSPRCMPCSRTTRRRRAAPVRSRRCC